MSNLEKIPSMSWGGIDLKTGISYIGIGNPAFGWTIPCGKTDPEILKNCSYQNETGVENESDEIDIIDPISS